MLVTLFDAVSRITGSTYLWQPFPAEQSDEDDPENLESLSRLGLVSVQRFQDGGDGQISWIQHLCWPEECRSHHARNTISHELGGHGDENTSSGVRVSSVEKLLHSQSLG